MPKKPPCIERAIVSVSPSDEEHDSLGSILELSGLGLFRARALPAALPFLRTRRVAVILCDEDGLPGTWEGALEETRQLTNPPAVIVTSRLADERLWAEALNLGAYDVLLKPFDREEVTRVVGAAWRQWMGRLKPSAATHPMRAGNAA
jgi:DNA-binding response OmpR family regulator